jgi:uncharacterized protein (UPF0332 family)
LTPEAGLYLDKAHRLLREAEAMLSIGLNEASGRTAYLAAFHSSQAIIFEMARRTVKTHQGVQTELLRLMIGRQDFDADLRAFLAQSYKLKTVADYDIGSEAELSTEQAAAALQGARRFVAYFATLLAAT